MANSGQPKRILVLNYEFPPLGGGGGIATYKLAKGFIQLGYGVDYITSWYKGLKRFEVVDGINVYRVLVVGRTGLQTASMISMLSFPIAGLWRGIKLCRQNRYEFINTQFVIPTGPLGYILSKLFHTKNVLSLHGGDVYDPTKSSSPHRHWYLRLVIRFLLNRADRIVAQSSNTKANCVEYYHPAKEIDVIPLPYEPFVFEQVGRGQLGLSKEKKYIIGVGRLVKRKGFDTFIKALSLLDKNIEGIILGDGPEREALETLARDLGVSERLHLLGQVSEEKKFQYLSNADVFVLSSVHEGFGIVLQEAMQVGLPIVATNNGGQVDLIKDGTNGLFFNVASPSELSTKVKKVLFSENLKSEFSHHNFKKITEFEPRVICQELIKLIKDNESN